MTARTMHPAEANLRAALNTLAERWERIAANEEAAIPLFEGPAAESVANSVRERIHAYRKAADDTRQVLRTGRIPHDLMTDAELEQHGTPERES
ncbi:hypothetical protein AB0M92_18800 [Streptomyces sp. NPDC051582]|uniref:hypothetical protein n=1 Tax=Streptomyces sp. NPDC051582 TaxID=3155167 RepID=UPI00344A782E